MYTELRREVTLFTGVANYNDRKAEVRKKEVCMKQCMVGLNE
jgi:hypothetical protein